MSEHKSEGYFMKVRRRILSSILTAGMVVALFQAVALGAPETISGSFTIDTENVQPDPTNPDAPPVSVEKQNI